MNDQALKAEEVAALLHIGRNAVYALAKSGDLPSYRMGRKLLFTLDDVERYRHRQRTGAETQKLASPHSYLPAAETSSRRPSGAISTALFTAPLRHCKGDPSATQAPEPHAPAVLAGQGLALDLIADRLTQEGQPIERAALESYAALVALYEGSVDGALIHLYDQRTNTYNVPYVQQLAPGVPVVVLRLVSRSQGFAVASGNPRGISSWGALLRPGLRLANRPLGCGARVLLDEKLLALEARPAAIEGYQDIYPSGLTAMQAVAAGRADVAVVEESLGAQIDGVAFVPLQREWLDLVVAKRCPHDHLARALRSLLSDGAFAREYGRVTHGDITQFGSIIYEC